MAYHNGKGGVCVSDRSANAQRHFVTSHHAVAVYFTVEEYDRLQTLLRKGQWESPTQWARKMLSQDEAQRKSEAVHFMRKTVPLDFAQDAERLFIEKADALMALAKRYSTPAQRTVQRELRQQAGRYMNQAGWCRDVINSYDLLAESPSRPPTESNG